LTAGASGAERARIRGRCGERGMKALKLLTAAIARGLTSDERVARALCRFNNRARILMIHRVGTPEYPAEVFRRQLRFLSRVFRLVPLAQVLELEAGGSDGRPMLALTFDDGLKSNLTAAYPLLKDFRAPAAFFICPALVESGRWLWNHECRARLSRMSADDRRLFSGELGLQSSDIDVIVQRLKYLPRAERGSAEESLRRLTGRLRPTETERLKYDLMSWSDLRALDPQLVSIGGHSTDHEILTRVARADLEGEVGECKRWLERELDRPVQNFCYPDGAYNAEVTECVGRYFDLAVTTEKRFVPLRPSPLRLPRIPMAESVRDLAWRVHRPTG
jgi:peptidoglycan/xylan/chitin deacetylase (PgdA/CDA1 family)